MVAVNVLVTRKFRGSLEHQGMIGHDNHARAVFLYVVLCCERVRAGPAESVRAVTPWKERQHEVQRSPVPGSVPASFVLEAVSNVHVGLTIAMQCALVVLY